MPKKRITNITQKAHIELDLIASKNMRITAFVSFVLSFIYGVTVYSAVDHKRLWVWLCFMSVFFVSRCLVWESLKRIDVTEPNNKWQRKFFTLKCIVLVGAVIWGGAALFVFPENDVNQQMVLVCLLLGLAAGALSSMAVIAKFYKIYISLILLPLVARFAYEGSSHYITLIILTAFYFMTLIVMVDKIYASIFSSICLRLENESLLHEVFITKDNLEKTNATLRNEIKEHKDARLQLEVAQQRLEKAYLVKNQFLTNMSHELKTPMTGIAGLTLQLQQSPLDVDQKKLLYELDECSTEMIFLIDNLLDFTKIESGDIVLNENVFNLQNLLDELATIFRPKAAKKGLEISVVPISSKLQWLFGDSLRLKQVLFNLLDNAIKFTENGFVKLSVVRDETTSPSLQPEKDLEIVDLLFCVEDTGSGIDKGKTEVIFSTFHQLNNSLTREQGGTGIGLAISKKLVDLMKGNIWCDSVPGKGTRFYIKICLQLADKPYVERQEKTHLSILIVDDNALNRKLLQSMLKKKNFNPYTAKNGLEALKVIAQKQVELIFMDIQMPVLDGLNTARIIRCLEKGTTAQIEKISSEISPELLDKLHTHLVGNHVVIISITANLIQGTESEFLDSGIDYHLKKPFQPEDIFNVIKIYFSIDTSKDTICRNEKVVPELKLVSDIRLESNPTESQSTIVHRAQAEQFLKDKYYLDNDSINTMMTTVIESLTSLFQEADQALAEKKITSLKEIAHSLKGSLANIGFSELAEKAHDIETSILEDSDFPYTEMLAHLKDCLAELMQTDV